MSGRTPRSHEGNVDGMMNEILDALDLIKSKMPNGEIKVIQEKIAAIETSQEDMHDDLRLIKKQLLDPEDGLVVRVNKNTEFRKKKEDSERDYSKFIDEHKELMNWKDTVTKFLWIIITSIAGIIVTMMFGKFGQ
jgi:hypothetical protein